TGAATSTGAAITARAGIAPGSTFTSVRSSAPGVAADASGAGARLAAGSALSASRSSGAGGRACASSEAGEAQVVEDIAAGFGVDHDADPQIIVSRRERSAVGTQR